MGSCYTQQSNGNDDNMSIDGRSSNINGNKKIKMTKINNDYSSSEDVDGDDIDNHENYLHPPCLQRPKFLFEKLETES